MNQTLKGVLLLVARRLATTLATLAVAHGAVDVSQQGASIEIMAGLIVWVAEFSLEWWRKTGMVLISKKLAEIKKIPLPQQPSSTVLVADGTIKIGSSTP